MQKILIYKKVNSVVKVTGTIIYFDRMKIHNPYIRKCMDSLEKLLKIFKDAPHNTQKIIVLCN